MLEKITKNSLQKKQTDYITKAEVIPLSHLNLSSDNISNEALTAVKILQQNNYQAFIVGGAPRDLVLYQTPKDFDIATNALPLEIKKLFKWAHIIGKRFPLVHIRIGNQILEVSTFRSGSNEITTQGKILRDDQYGSIHDDAQRRDFTCNALYLDPIHKTLYCYHNGLTHLKEKRLVMIGVAEKRFREDPVRILRAARIATKTNLIIDKSLLDSMQQNAYLLTGEPNARLFDELTKIIYSKHSYQCIELLKNLNILSFIHPITQLIDQYTKQNDQLLVKNTLVQTDKRLKNTQSISISFIISAILWPLVNQIWEQNKINRMKSAHALHEAILTILGQYRTTWDIPNKNLASMNEIWRLQNRLENAKSKQQIQKLLYHPGFRAGYDLFLLRANSNYADLNKARYWTKIVQDQVGSTTKYQRNKKTMGNNPVRSST